MGHYLRNLTSYDLFVGQQPKIALHLGCQETQRGGTLTTSTFGCPNALKWVTLSNRAWFKDEKNGMVYHDWINRSRDICIFRSKYGKIRHFWYDVIFFYLNIFENGFLYRKDLIEYFKKMYRFYTIGHTVHEINAFEILKKCKKSADSAKNSIFGGTSNAFISWTVCPIVLNLYIFFKCSMRPFLWRKPFSKISM
jgi:hypothetical protein